MRIESRGLLNSGQPGTCRAISTFPSVTPLRDGTLLATYRVGSTKDSADETIELRRSEDGGVTWGDPVSPFATMMDGTLGSLRVAYVTPLSGDHLLAAAMWVDREAYPGQPLFNEQTEGCLPMLILLSDSYDLGQTWAPWRKLPLPAEVGPQSLTNPILKLHNGKLAVSVETNKTYEDASPWFQSVVYAFSEDYGQSWSSPLTTCQDRSGKIFHWDQRAGVAPDGQLVTYTWTYDRKANRYLNIHRRRSSDDGESWTEAEELEITDQPSHPAMLPDGTVVLAWVDRFQSRSIRARLAESIESPFLSESEVVLFELDRSSSDSVETETSTGELLTEMNVWNYGLPYAETLPDGDVIIVYYAGTSSSMQIHWVRLTI